MADSQVRAALIHLGAGVRADFLHTLAAWQGDWLRATHTMPHAWLAVEPLATALGHVQASFDSLHDLHQFLTAGFLPGVATPREAPAAAAPVQSTHTAPGLAPLGRAAGATSPVLRPAADRTPPPPMGAEDQANPSAGEQVAALPPPHAEPPQAQAVSAPTPSSTVSPSTLAPTLAPTLAFDSGTSPVPGALRVGGLRALAQAWPHLDAAAAARELAPDGTAPPPRIGALRDLAQGLPEAADPSTWWDAQPAAVHRKAWTADAPDAPDATKPHATDLMSSAGMGGALGGAIGAPTAPADGTSPVAPTAKMTPPSSLPALQGPVAAHLPAAPMAAMPPVLAAPPPVDDLLDALAREITREYHRYYGA